MSIVNAGYGYDVGDKLQIIINEYVPGQGISKHIDDPKQFGEWIMCISLGSHVEMTFDDYDISLNPCSLVVMTGDSRYKYTHQIKSRKSDKGIPRTTRVSITFRFRI